MISEDMLCLYAKEAAVRMNNSLPKPEQCSHRFSELFQKRMALLVPRKRRITLYDVKSAAACLLLLFLLGAESAVLISPAVREETIHAVTALPTLFYWDEQGGDSL